MAKRESCSQCERPLKTCLCDVMTCLHSRYQLVILQDPKEAKHALSSAPILEKSIYNARRIVGEVFDPSDIFGSKWMNECLVIFPSKNSISIKQAKEKNYKYLILIDGTWKKVSKIFHINPWLVELPCIAIQPSQNSEYLIRKSPRKDGLSTIEAAVNILNALEPEKDFQPILKAFNKMIDLQIQAMGHQTFKQNYDQ